MAMPLEPLGPFRVTVDPARARAFCAEIGFAGEGVPLSYPALWLSEHRVKALIEAVCAAEDAVPVHESQSFARLAPLQAGAIYDLTVVPRREATPPRLILEATVTALDGAPCLRLETMLRIVPRAALKAPA